MWQGARAEAQAHEEKLAEQRGAEGLVAMVQMGVACSGMVAWQVVLLGFGGAAVVFLLFGLAGLGCFGASTGDNVLESFEKTAPALVARTVTSLSPAKTCPGPGGA